MRLSLYTFSIRHPHHGPGGFRDYSSRKKAEEARRALLDGGYMVGNIVKVPR